MGEVDTAGISLLPLGKIPTVSVVADSVGSTPDLPLAFDMAVAFPIVREGRPALASVEFISAERTTESYQKMQTLARDRDEPDGGPK